MVQTYNPRTGESRDYASLAALCDESDRQGMTVCPTPDPSPLLWIECGVCGADVAFGVPQGPCPQCGASECPPGCTGCECCR
jgi:hypothetical protein